MSAHLSAIRRAPVYKHILVGRRGQNEEIIMRFPSALPLTRPGMRGESFHHLLLQRCAAAVAIGQFKPVNKAVMGSEPAVISSPITWDISR